MSRQQKLSWAAAASGVAAALGVATWVARSVAQAEVAPVDKRVVAVEIKQSATDERLKSIDGKLDKLIDMHLKKDETR